jgi:hypothetical protein
MGICDLHNALLPCKQCAQSLSASVLSHLETPCGPALRLYPFFSSLVQRKPTRSVAGFLMGGLPLGRLVAMPRLCTHK